MRKKFLALIFGVAALACCAFGLSACETNGSGDNGTDGAHTHVWAESWDKDGSHHWHGCTYSGCTEKNGYAVHDFANGDCVCGQKNPVQDGEIPPEEPDKPGEHSHVWAEAWDKDGTHHWHNCTDPDCTEKVGYTEHDFTNGDCVCGQQKPATEGLLYELNSEGTAYVCAGIGTATDSEIIIASEYNNLPVTAIKERAFAECNSLAKVFIPQSIEIMGSKAFYGCDFLIIECEVAEEPEGWEEGWASGNRLVTYYNCKNNSHEDIDGITYRLHTNGNAVVTYQPKNLSGKIVIPSEVVFNDVTYTVTGIDGESFYGCTQITEIVTSKSMVAIGNCAFMGCSSLESITLPFVGGKVYSASITTVDWRDYLFGYVFGNYYYEGSYVAEQKYHKTQNGTQRTYTQKNYLPVSLKNVTILGGSCEYGSFSGCNLESLTLSNDIRVKTSAFKLENRTGLGDTDYIACTVKNVTAPVGYISYLPKDNLETLTVLDTTDAYTTNAISSRDKLSNCSTLKTLNLSGNLVRIDDAALSGCSALTEINFGGTVEEWNALVKGTDWDKDTGEYIVHCTDGEEAKSQTAEQ